jgi:hypothetical protein
MHQVPAARFWAPADHQVQSGHHQNFRAACAQHNLNPEQQRRQHPVAQHHPPAAPIESKKSPRQHRREDVCKKQSEKSPAGRLQEAPDQTFILVSPSTDEAGNVNTLIKIPYLQGAGQKPAPNKKVRHCFASSSSLTFFSSRTYIF